MSETCHPWSNEIPHPVDRTLNLLDYSPDIIIDSWQRQVDTNDCLNFVLDLDENLFDTVFHWVKHTNRFLRMFGGIQSDELPSHKDVCVEGGPSVYYPHHFPDIFPDINRYEILADELRHRKSGNVSGPPMSHDIASVHEHITNAGTLLGGLTARPATDVVVGATRQQVRMHFTTEFPIIYKPTHIPLSKASTMKLDVLARLATPTSAGTVVLIDDSISVARLIAEWNRTTQGKSIIQILNGAGPLTRPLLEADKFTLGDARGIFVMHTWDNLLQTIHAINDWLQTQN